MTKTSVLKSLVKNGGQSLFRTNNASDKNNDVGEGVPMNEQKIREEICAAGERLYRFGLVVANDGNISFRLDDNKILTTPTGVCKGDMSPEMLVVVDDSGRVLSEGKPSSELPLHLFIYNERPDIRSVVHAHPPFATAFATAGLALDRCVSPEIITTIGSIPIARYGTPSTQELPESLRPYVQDHEAILLANHGAVTMGRDIWEAYFKMERLEHYAKIILLSRMLGGEKELAAQEVEKLAEIRQSYGVEAVDPGCEVEPQRSPKEDDCGCGHDHQPSDLSYVEMEKIAEKVWLQLKDEWRF